MKPTPWSYSSLTSFETCPRRHKLTRITKEVVEPTSEAMRHGTQVHEALEKRLLGTPLPDKYQQYEPVVAAVLATPGEKSAELKFGLTKSREPTDFFGTDAWVRGVLDVAVVRSEDAVILDYKLGKPRPDSDQLRLFAAAAFSLFPEVQTVKTGFVWLAYNRLDKETYQREDAPAIWQEFEGRVTRMTLAYEVDQFPPRPSGLCRAWCPVPRRLCEFSGKD